MAFPFFILTSSVWELPLLYILISIQCCQDSRCGHLKLYLTVVLICHPLVTQDVVHLYKFIAILYTFLSVEGSIKIWPFKKWTASFSLNFNRPLYVSACNAGDPSSILGWKDPLEKG